MEITKREALFSAVIICIMLVIGIVIADGISDSVMERQQQYITALQIDNDADLFQYGMRTNVGNALVYGELQAIDPVTYPEIEGDYSYIEKVKERYTRHTRVVTHTRTVNGKTQTYTTTEAYWTWDVVDRWSEHSNAISFLGVEFDYGTIRFPSESYICTIKESSNIRYVYYGSPTYSVGTVHATLKDNTINDVTMYHNYTIAETIDAQMHDGSVVLFWVGWIILTALVVGGFYYIDNRWLEDN